MARGLFALEDMEVVDEVAVDDTLVTDVISLNNEYEKISDLSDRVLEALAVIEELNVTKGLIKKTVDANEILSIESLQMLSISISSIRRRVSLENSGLLELPSLESYTTKASAKTLLISLEEAEESIFNKIKKFLVKLFEQLKAFFIRVLDIDGRIFKSIEAIAKDAEDAKNGRGYIKDADKAAMVKLGAFIEDIYKYHGESGEQTKMYHKVFGFFAVSSDDLAERTSTTKKQLDAVVDKLESIRDEAKSKLDAFKKQWVVGTNIDYKAGESVLDCAKGIINVNRSINSALERSSFGKAGSMAKEIADKILAGENATRSHKADVTYTVRYFIMITTKFTDQLTLNTATNNSLLSTLKGVIDAGTKNHVDKHENPASASTPNTSKLLELKAS